MVVIKETVDTIPKFGYFEYVENYKERRNKLCTYPFVFAGFQFREDYPSLFLDTDVVESKNKLAETMYKFWEDLRTKTDKAQYTTLFENVKNIAISKGHEKYDQYNDFIYYLSDKYLKNEAIKELLVMSKSEGMGALKARKNDLNDYYGESVLFNGNVDAINDYSTHTKALISKTDSLLEVTKYLPSTVEPIVTLEESEEEDKKKVVAFWEKYNTSKSSGKNKDRELCWWQKEEEDEYDWPD